jgi:phospholipid-binding lipoprotein MlaA
LEPLNRNILDINQFVDRILIRPVAKVYVALLPEDGRDAIRRVLDNMKEPSLFFNNVLQGEFERAGITLGRFTANTSLGLVGIFDVAAMWGLKRQTADFGQTLFVWGFPKGPYLILPILGPSNPRDAIGMGIDSYADPFTILATIHGIEEWTNARLIADGIDRRARVIDVLDDLEKSSLDYYAQLRSLSQQNRAAELRRGAAPHS